MYLNWNYKKTNQLKKRKRRREREQERERKREGGSVKSKQMNIWKWDKHEKKKKTEYRMRNSKIYLEKKIFADKSLSLNESKLQMQIFCVMCLQLKWFLV